MTMDKETYTILVVEDDAAIRKSTATYFQEKGYEVVCASNGQHALQLLEKAEADVLLTDLRISGLDGIDLLKAALEQKPPIPTIIVSGMGTMQDAIEALRLGAFDYIIKPVQDMELILHSVERALTHSKLIEREKKRKEELEMVVQQRTMELLLQNEQLNHEIEERQTQEALVLQAKQEWERTVDAIPDMIAIVDGDHNIVRMNKSMRDTFQKKYSVKSEEEYNAFLGEPCYCHIHGTNYPYELCPHEKTMADGKSHTVEMYTEHQGRYFEVTTVPYRNKEEEVIGSVHVVRDISDRKREEKEKEKLQSQLLHAQKLESVGQLAAGIAHEINTPTQFIGTNIDFLDDACQDIIGFMEAMQKIVEKAPDEIREKIEEAMEEADWDYLAEEFPHAISQSKDGVKRVSSIVRAMKEFSHPGSKEKKLSDINRIIETTVTVARNEWKYVADVELDLEEALPQVPLMADEMGQVVLNMLVNAAHAIGEKLGENSDTTKGSIVIRTRKVDDQVELVISDTGMGIPEKSQSRIFDPFYTTKKVGKGTGQGLAISHDVITEKHGGSVSFTTALGKGTNFIIRLPVT